MRILSLTTILFVTIIRAWIGFGLSVSVQTNTQAPLTFQKEKVVTAHATGSFEVKVTPQTPSHETADNKEVPAGLGRMSIDKQFHGDLEATSKGQMLTAGTAIKASAGYVALEQVSGTLHGRTGTFILQHSGTMTRGAPHLSITVIPDSGTGQLEGLSGAMTIKIADRKHSYDFEYSLPKID